MDDEITVRPATEADIADLVRLRRTMFESMGYGDLAQLAASDAAAEAYLREAIPSGAFHGWLAVTAAGEAVCSGGVVIDRHPPGPGNLTGEIGYIMNVVTVPAHRQQGIARRVMRTIISWLEEKGIERVALHATEMGRPLYRQLGFVDSSEMRLHRT